VREVQSRAPDVRGIANSGHVDTALRTDFPTTPEVVHELLGYLEEYEVRICESYCDIDSSLLSPLLSLFFYPAPPFMPQTVERNPQDIRNLAAGLLVKPPNTSLTRIIIHGSRYEVKLQDKLVFDVVVLLLFPPPLLCNLSSNPPSLCSLGGGEENHQDEHTLRGGRAIVRGLSSVVNLFELRILGCKLSSGFTDALCQWLVAAKVCTTLCKD